GGEALELVAVGKADRVDDVVERAPLGLQRLEDAVNGCDVVDIAWKRELGATLIGKRLHAAAEGFTLVGEGEFGAMLSGVLGDAPGDGVVVRDAHDEAALALQQSSHLMLPVSPGSAGTPALRSCRRTRTSWKGRCRSWRCRCAREPPAFLQIPDRSSRCGRFRR